MFSPSRSGQVYWSAVAVTLVVLGIWLAFAWIVSTDHARAKDAEVIKNTNMVNAQAERANRGLRMLDQTLLTLRDDYLRLGRPASISERLAALHVDRQAVGIVSLIGADGRVISSTEKALDGNFADRDYFVRHAAAQDDQLLIGLPIKGRFSGRWLISLTRRLTDARGGFAGVVFMAVNPDFFAADSQSLKLQPHAAMAMIGLDGITRVRRRGNEISYGGDVKGSQLFTELRRSPSGHYAAVAASDGIKRTASYRQLDDYPMVMVAASSLDDIEREFIVRDVVSFVVALALSLLLIVGFLVGMRARRVQAEAAWIQSRLETQLRESQKMQAIGTLAGGVAHDFNNIVTLILGNLRMIGAEAGRLDANVQDCLGEIRKATLRARDLVGQILSFGRRNAVHSIHTRLDAVVEEAVELLRKTLPSRVEVEFVRGGETPMASVDPNLLQQVLLNLGTNAADAMEGGPGKITVQLQSLSIDALTRKLHPSLSELGQAHDGPAVQLTVRDTGPGIDAALQPRVFEPFFTTKPVGKGTGLGLAVVHGIVSAHGGVIWTQNHPHGGAEFVIVLPGLREPDATVQQAQPASAAAPAAAGVANPAARSRPRRVLYLDDDEALLFLFKRMLERDGLEVTTCDSAAEALRLLTDAHQAWDMVITDYNMPDKNGLQFAAEVRSLQPDLPIAMASGFVDETLQARAAELGVCEVLFKAGAVEEFAHKVIELLERGELARR